MEKPASDVSVHPSMSLHSFPYIVRSIWYWVNWEVYLIERKTASFQVLRMHGITLPNLHVHLLSCFHHCRSEHRLYPITLQTKASEKSLIPNILYEYFLNWECYRLLQKCYTTFSDTIYPSWYWFQYPDFVYLPISSTDLKPVQWLIYVFLLTDASFSQTLLKLNGWGSRG